MPSEKKRVSYDKDMRSDAKKAECGLVTISVTFPDGTHEEYQTLASPKDCRLARWVGVAFQHEEARGALPDIENLIREQLESLQD